MADRILLEIAGFFAWPVERYLQGWPDTLSFDEIAKLESTGPDGKANRAQEWALLKLMETAAKNHELGWIRPATEESLVLFDYKKLDGYRKIPNIPEDDIYIEVSGCPEMALPPLVNGLAEDGKPGFRMTSTYHGKRLTSADFYRQWEGRPKPPSDFIATWLEDVDVTGTAQGEGQPLPDEPKQLKKRERGEALFVFRSAMETLKKENGEYPKLPQVKAYLFGERNKYELVKDVDTDKRIIKLGDKTTLDDEKIRKKYNRFIKAGK